MTDFALAIENGVCDFALDNADLAVDEGLESSVLISLFTDSRVDGDEIPEGETDPRGFWGDVKTQVEGDSTGSKLWLLSREKLTRVTATRAKQYCQESLAWLIEDGIASGVSVATDIVSAKLLAIQIEIEKPSGGVSYTYDYIWQSQGLKA